MSDRRPGRTGRVSAAAPGEPAASDDIQWDRRADEGELVGRAQAGVRWGLVNQAIQQSTKLVTTIVLTRLIPPAEMGLFATSMVVVNLGQLLNGLGFGPALVHRPNLTERHVRAALTGSAALGVVFGGSIAAGAAPLARFFDEPDLRAVLMAISIIFLAKGVESVPNDMLRRNLLFREYVLSSSIASVVSAAAAVVAAAAGLDVWALVVYALVDAFVASSLGWVFAIRARVWRPGFTFDWGATRDLASYSLYITMARLLTYVQMNGDNLAVAKVLGKRAVGYYNLAFRLFLFPIQKVSQVLGQVAFPTLAAVQHQPERLRRGFLRGLRYTASVTLPLSLGLAVTAPYLVPILFGDRWRPAVTALQILSLSGPRAAVTQLNANAYQAVGKPQWSLWTSVVAAPAYVIGIVIGVDHGIEGVAVGVCVAGYLAMPWTMYLVGRAIDMSSWSIAWTLWPIYVSTAAMVATSWGAGQLLGDGASDVLHLVVMVAVGGLTYLVLLQVLAQGLTKEILGQLTGRDGTERRATNGTVAGRE